jgi:iron complex outermembrane receptor protein
VRHETFRSKNLLKGATDPGNDPQKRLTLVASASDDLYLLHERLTVMPLALLTYYKNDFSGTLPFSFFPDVDDHDDDLLLDLKLGGRYKLTDSLSIKANVGRFHRIPNFTELFGDRGSIVGNPKLDPERAYNADVGFVFEKRNVAKFINRIYLEAAGFYSDIDDIIVFVQNSQRTFRAQNLESARILGVEAAWSFSLWKHLLLSGNVTWQDPKDTSDSKFYHDKQLPGRAEFELFQRSEIYFSYFRIFHELSILSENFIDRANLRKFDDRTIQNAGVIFYPFGSNKLSLSLEVKNITDEEVEDIEGFPLPGRSYFSKLTYSF